MKLTDKYIVMQPTEYQSVLLHIVNVVERIVPEIAFYFKFGVPYFYYRKKPFCYLASNPKKGFVDLGFARGFQLKGNQEYLVSENRNTVKSLRYTSLSAIDNLILEAVIREALTLYS